MIECYRCGFWDSDREGCTCFESDMWYACPIESSKPENQEELKKMFDSYLSSMYGGETDADQ